MEPICFLKILQFTCHATNMGGQIYVTNDQRQQGEENRTLDHKTEIKLYGRNKKEQKSENRKEKNQKKEENLPKGTVCIESIENITLKHIFT